MKRTNKQKPVESYSMKGFTIVEISLAMAFIASILIFIAIITVNILSIYQKGMVVKAVNSVGRGLIENFEGAINSAPAFNVENSCTIPQRMSGVTVKDDAIDGCRKDQATRAFFYNSRIEDTDSNKDEQLYGVFCTGSYSYVWNTPYGVEEGKTLKLRYFDGTDTVTYPGEGDDPIKLARLRDPNRRVCSTTVDLTQYNDDEFRNGENGYTLDITTYADNESKFLTFSESDIELNLLSGTDVDLWLYELTIFPFSLNSTTGRAFAAGTFILATKGGGINIMGAGDYCNNVDKNGDGTTSSLFDLGAGFNYCAINKFNFAARTIGG